jgi:hypothetical protein
LSIDLIHKSSVSKELQAIAEKVFALQRITAEEGLLLLFSALGHPKNFY